MASQEAAPLMTSAQGAKAGIIMTVEHVIGRNPTKTAWAILMMVAVIIALTITIIVLAEKYKDCKKGEGMLGTNPLGNLNTGSNNPLWHHQMGDAGWGGSMHSTYQQGQSRVWGASAEGGHDMAVVPQSVHGCGGVDCSVSSAPACAVGAAAVGEAHALLSAQAFEPAESAKNMSDDALMLVMNGSA